MADVSCGSTSFAPHPPASQKGPQNRGRVLWSDLLLTLPRNQPLPWGPLRPWTLESLFSKPSANFRTVLAPKQHVAGG